jgi:hypothetical protein
MDHGVIAQRGTPQDLYERPASAFVAGFMGEAMLFPVRPMARTAVRLGPLRIACEGPVAGRCPGGGPAAGLAWARRARGWPRACSSGLPGQLPRIHLRHRTRPRVRGLGGVFSGDVKFLKPEREIYEVLAMRYGLDPEQTVFIDDSAANVEMARAFGWHAIHCTSPAALPSQLQRYLPVSTTLSVSNPRLRA